MTARGARAAGARSGVTGHHRGAVAKLRYQVAGSSAAAISGWPATRALVMTDRSNSSSDQPPPTPPTSCCWVSCLNGKRAGLQFRESHH